MALPKSYLTSTKNLGGILAAIQGAQPPEKFTQTFLENLEFKSSSDRLFINVFKALGFLDGDGSPTDRYYQFLDQTQSQTVMADAIRETYTDIYQVNRNAHQMDRKSLINKLRTITQGAHKDSVLDKMALTFLSLVKHADFSNNSHSQQVTDTSPSESISNTEVPETFAQTSERPKLRGLQYHINIVLPATRDTKIYDAIFKSLRDHIE